MEQIFNIVLLVFALVVLPATWYYSKKTDKLPKHNKPFISDLEKTRKEHAKINVVAILFMAIALLVVVFLIELGVF
jgi:predicted RND superfamily exporter protein